MMEFDLLKESVKDGNDIVDIINSYVPLKRAGTNFKALCPFHSEKTPSFSVNPTKQIFYCFGCQKGGDVFRFVMELERVDFMGALRILASRAGIHIPETALGNAQSKDTQSSTIRKDQLYEIHEKLTIWYEQNLRNDEVPREYLKRRGINEEVQQTFRLGSAPDSWCNTLNWGKTHGFSAAVMKQAGIITVKNETDPMTKAYDRFRNRLMFPIWNEQGRVIAFSGRVFAEQKTGGAKYVNSPETPIFTKGRILYGLHLARAGISHHGSVLLCEGQMDVIACHQAGFNNAVASLGTSFTEIHACLLKRYTDNVILLFDADQAGINAIIKSITPILAAGLTPKVALLDEGEDPDSVIQKSGPNTLIKKINEAEDYFIFRLNLEKGRHNLSTPEGKEKVAVSVLKDISLLESIVRRAEYCRIMADHLQISESILFQELNRIIKPQKTHQSAGDQFKTARDSTNLFSIKENLTAKAETILLGIVIRHNNYALKLLEDLPQDFISNSPTGQALNTALAHTGEGEWENIESVLVKNLEGYHSKEVNKALFDPDYGLGIDDKILQKAYTDCLYRGIILPRIDEQMGHLQKELKSCSSREGKTEIREKYLTLRKQKSEFYLKLAEKSF